MTDDLAILQAAVHHRFARPELLSRALVHSSHANENPGEGEDNERLEFLGDAVLELAVSEELFRRFPTADEGRLTSVRAKMVREKTLAEVARSLALPEFLKLGRGEEAQGGRERDSILADLVEAVIGAVFLDGGFAAARDCVLHLLDGRWPEAAQLPASKDYKSRLQEVTQEKYKARPVYHLVSSQGPEHTKVFTVRLELPGGQSTEGEGGSLKKAEQLAASRALKLLEAQG